MNTWSVISNGLFKSILGYSYASDCKKWKEKAVG